MIRNGCMKFATSITLTNHHPIAKVIVVVTFGSCRSRHHHDRGIVVDNTTKRCCFTTTQMNPFSIPICQRNLFVLSNTSCYNNNRFDHIYFVTTTCPQHTNTTTRRMNTITKRPFSTILGMLSDVSSRCTFRYNDDVVDDPFYDYNCSNSSCMTTPKWWRTTTQKKNSKRNVSSSKKISESNNNKVDLLTTTITPTDVDNDENGRILYEQYVQIKEQMIQLTKDKEIQKSKQMYEAWEKADQIEKQKQKDGLYSTDMKSKNQGIAVVKTLVRQTRTQVQIQQKNIKQQEQEQQKDEMSMLLSPESQLQKQANELLKVSALQYEHPPALVEYGNRLFEKMEQQQQQQEGHSSDQEQQQNDDNVQQQQVLLMNDILHYYQLAGEKGLSAGYYNLGHFLWTGVPAEEEEEVEMSDDKDDNENKMDAHDDIALNNTNQQQPTKILVRNKQKAMDAFLKALHLDDADALYFVGVQYLNATEDDDYNNYFIHDTTTTTTTTTNHHPHIQSVKELKELGLQYITTSANKHGHGHALYYLVLFHAQGCPELNIPPCEPTVFVELLNAACTSISVVPDALFLRGNHYFYGTNGYPQNDERALADFLLASEYGNADAAVSAGAMLYHMKANSYSNSTSTEGTQEQQQQQTSSTPQQRAFELYQHAGELGSITGWYNVVDCYKNGMGVPQSKAMAEYITDTMIKPYEERMKHANEKK